MKQFPIKKIDLLIALLIVSIYALLSLKAFPPSESLGKIIYGIQMRLDLPQNLGSNKVAIVNIDNKSIAQLGPWPWPRKIIAEMIPILKNNGAKLIGLHLLFSEKGQNPGLREIRDLEREVQKRPEQNPWLIETLKDMEQRLDHDRILAQNIKECGNVYLPVVGTIGKYDTEFALPEDSFIKNNTISINGFTEDLITATKLNTPFSELAESSRGLGHINLAPDKSKEGQVHPLVINYRGNVIPSLAFRLALDQLNKSPEEAMIPGKGILLTDTLIPTRSGEVFIKYRGSKRSFPYYSFVDILNVKKVPAVFVVEPFAGGAHSRINGPNG